MPLVSILQIAVERVGATSRNQAGRILLSPITASTLRIEPLASAVSKLSADRIPVPRRFAAFISIPTRCASLKADAVAISVDMPVGADGPGGLKNSTLDDKSRDIRNLRLWIRLITRMTDH